MVPTIRFPNRNPAEFIAEMKRRVAAHFEAHDGRTKGDWRMVSKTIVLLGVYFGAYALILTDWFSPLGMLGLSVVMGVGMAGIGFAVGHDALHGAYSEKPWVNRLVGYTFDVLGANGYMWKKTHNIDHHTYTNIEGVDGDLDASSLLRLSPHSAHRPIHRYQHWYAFAAYSVSTLIWGSVKDFQYFLRADGGPYRTKQHPTCEVVSFIATKLLYYGYTLAVPMLVLEVAWWQVMLGWLALHLTAGLILGVIFQLAHVVEETAYPVPDAAGNMEHAWLVHELETTANFARRNRLLTWYVGGLNYQIEHHLYPRVCSIHYPAIAEIVRSVALANGMPYHEHTTLRGAIRSHVRVLRRLGQGVMAVGDSAVGLDPSSGQARA
ncbi:MAG: acyl-CoA desaturase [Gemmatimonadota bacterium]